jgi:hypothetical protein
MLALALGVSALFAGQVAAQEPRKGAFSFSPVVVTGKIGKTGDCSLKTGLTEFRLGSSGGNELFAPE